MSSRLISEVFIVTVLSGTLSCAVYTASASRRPLGANQYAVPLVERFERPAAHERETIDRIVKHATDHFARAYCKANPRALCCAASVAETINCGGPGTRATQPAHRDAHAKHHGCVIGDFEALPTGSLDLAQGVFATGSRYSTVVRFSNGHPTPQPDQVGDGRGMAIKLLGVPGAKILSGLVTEPTWREEETATQDFLLINSPRFFIPDVKTYEDFSLARDSGSAARLLGFFLLHPRVLLIVHELRSKPAYSPLEISYHSMTPFLLGTPDRGAAVKYRVDPISCTDGSVVTQTRRSTEGDDYLRDALRARLDPKLGSEPACFEISAVVARSVQASVENATDEWTVGNSDTVRLARLTIRPQRFDSLEQQQLCEDLAFTPWHALPVHQPIGGLNRLRLPLYRAISDLRARLNGATTAEPRGSSWDEVLRSARRTSQSTNGAERRIGE